MCIFKWSQKSNHLFTSISLEKELSKWNVLFTVATGEAIYGVNEDSEKMED